MLRVTIRLEPHEKKALRDLAKKERRNLPAQAALMIRRELEHLGLLSPAQQTVNQKPEVQNGVE